MSQGEIGDNMKEELIHLKIDLSEVEIIEKNDVRPLERIKPVKCIDNGLPIA